MWAHLAAKRSDPAKTIVLIVDCPGTVNLIRHFVFGKVAVAVLNIGGSFLLHIAADIDQVAGFIVVSIARLADDL